MTIESFFQLSHCPFGRKIPVSDLWIDGSRKEMQSRLKHVAENKSFGLFTGDSGVGKSTILRRFASSIDSNKFQIVYIADSALTPRNFYWASLRELGQIPRFHRVDARFQLQKVLGEIISSERKTPVFIIDEAHLLSHEMLEEVRFLLNVGMDSCSDLALILVGQTELREKLKLHINSAILQRVDMRYHLHPLSQEESCAYVKAHMASAHASRDIFTDTAIFLVHDYCSGIPRRINKLALSCLMAAASKELSLIDDHLVHIVIEKEFEM
jgi:type II secretory pathway predicted ATPase ExeA